MRDISHMSNHCPSSWIYDNIKLQIMLSGGIPNIKWCGVDGEDNVLVLDLLGPSLEDLFVYCGRKFSLKTVLLLADQMVRGNYHIRIKQIS